VIIYEAPLLRGLGSKKNPLVEVDSARIRVALQLPRESFVDLALLCGTDFSQRLKNIGPFTALKLIRKFNCIENLLVDPQLSSKLPDSEYLDDIAQARLVFAASPPMPEDEKLQQGTHDSLEVFSLLEKYGLAQLAKTSGETVYSLGATFDDVSSPAFAETGFRENLETHGSFDRTLPSTLQD
jgi:flap endonuclease-1